MSEPTRSRSGLPWQAYVAATVLAITAAGLVLVFASNRGDDDATTTQDAPSLTLRPMDEVPDGDPLDIDYTDVDDTTGTLRDLLGEKPLVVNFFAEWCTPCVAEMPDLEAVSQEVDGVRFFGLAVLDRPEDTKRIIRQTGVTYDWSRDVKGDIVAAFGIINMPSTAFITPDGTVAHIQPGAMDQDELRSLIEEHLGVSA